MGIHSGSNSPCHLHASSICVPVQPLLSETSLHYEQSLTISQVPQSVRLNPKTSSPDDATVASASGSLHPHFQNVLSQMVTSLALCLSGLRAHIASLRPSLNLLCSLTRTPAS